MGRDYNQLGGGDLARGAAPLVAASVEVGRNCPCAQCHVFGCGNGGGGGVKAHPLGAPRSRGKDQREIRRCDGKSFAHQ